MDSRREHAAERLETAAAPRSFDHERFESEDIGKNHRCNVPAAAVPAHTLRRSRNNGKVQHEFIDRTIPAIFLSHGAPPLADDPVWTRELATWSRDLPQPSAILVISAHWEEAPLTVGATSTVPCTTTSGGTPSTTTKSPIPRPEFDDWLSRQVEVGDVDALLDFQQMAPAAGIAHPRTEHFAPLFVTLGASVDRGEQGHTVVDGFWFGLSKRSLQFG
jgi:aromatic ring-opening dioxygenase catalytic subunit (LigB family)